MRTFMKILPIIILLIFALIIDNYFAGYLLSKGLTYKDTSLVTIMTLIGFCLGLLAMYIAQRFK